MHDAAYVCTTLLSATRCCVSKGSELMITSCGRIFRNVIKYRMQSALMTGSSFTAANNMQALNDRLLISTTEETFSSYRSLSAVQAKCVAQQIHSSRLNY